MAVTELAGFGEAMVLLQPAGPLRLADTVGVHVAGAELNLCAAAARAGIATAFCSRVGADPLGERIIDHAVACGVSTELVDIDETRPTGLFLKDIRPDGYRRVHYYRHGSAASALSEVDSRRLLTTRPGLVAVSGITSCLGDGPRLGVRALLRDAHTAGAKVAYDPNFRPALGDLDGQVAEARGLLSYVDYLMLGLDEALPLFGTADPAAVFAAAHAAGVAEVVVKAGADGCWHESPHGPAHMASQATLVIDPVGAGDAFDGGYLAARLRGATTEGAAWLASKLAAGVVAAPGDTDGLPPQEEARDLLAEAISQ